MTTTTIRVLTNFSKTTPAELISRANAVYAGLKENPDFINLPVELPAFRQSIDDFSAADTAALDGGAKAIAHRNAVGEPLKKMLRLLAHHAEDNCNGDMTRLLSSGFQPVNKIRTWTPPLSESIRKIEHGPSGEFLVNLVWVPSAAAYELRWAPVASGGSPGEWTSLPVAKSRAPIVVSGLRPGTSYMFQARTVLGSGPTPWSDPITRVCA